MARQTADHLAYLGCAFFLIIFSLVGTWDYQDAVAQDDHYTRMVCEGHWPDYEGRNPQCR